MLALALLGAAHPAQAADKAPPLDNKTIGNLISLGAKPFYLGNRYGLDGWFVVKGNEIQVVYITGDGQNTLVGALFDKDGENVTVQQIQALTTTSNELAQYLSRSVQAASATAGGMSPAPTGMPSLPGLSAAATPASPGDKLFADLAAAQSVSLGANAAAPQILMVADITDAASQKTWGDLRDAATKGTLRVMLIPTAAPDSEGEHIAAGLLQNPDPATAWNKFSGGDKAAITATSDPNAIITIRANHITIDRWNIKTLPYLVYRGKDGKVKIVQGRPEHISSILSDLP